MSVDERQMEYGKERIFENTYHRRGCQDQKILSMKVIADEHDHHDSRSLPELFENIIKSNSMTIVIGKPIINMIIIRLFIFLKLLFFIKLTNFTIYFTIKYLFLLFLFIFVHVF